MMGFEEMDASEFEFANYYYEQECKSLLEKIGYCYNDMIKNRVALPNDEDKIRDYIYLNYLKDTGRKAEFEINYHFECEPKEFGISNGYLDFKVFNENIFSNGNQYFIFECKRLNNQNTKGKEGLNGKYIKEGILRFVEKKYSTFHKVNGMIGFIVEAMNITDNIENINYLLSNEYKNANTTSKISSIPLMEGLPPQFSSQHNDSDGAGFQLIHLMLDFSKNIASS